MSLLQYRIYKDSANYWRWRLVAGNNRIVANSGEGYWNKSDCMSAIALVKGSANVPVYEV